MDRRAKLLLAAVAPGFGIAAYALLVRPWMEPARALVLVMPQDARSAIEKGYAPHGCWNFLLQAVGRDATRLIMRSIDAESGPPMGKLGGYVFLSRRISSWNAR